LSGIYTNIVYFQDTRSFEAVSCALCGANAREDKYAEGGKALFKGIGGLGAHFEGGHTPQELKEHGSIGDRILRTAVDLDDVQRMRNGLPPLKIITKVTAKDETQSRRRTAVGSRY